MGAKGLGVALALAAIASCALGACGGDAFTTGHEDGGSSEDAPGGGGDAEIEGGGGDDASAFDSGAPEAADSAAPDSSSHHDAVAVDVVGVPDSKSGGGDASEEVVGSTSKRVFVTSNAYSGDLGGVDGADAICQDLAKQANLGGTYLAWLSTSIESPATRFTRSMGPYVLVNGVPIAADWTALTSGTLLAPINVSEKGGPPPNAGNVCGETNASVVWSSTAVNGTLGTTQGATCSDWTTSGPSNGAILGFADRTDSGWTAGCASQGANATICGINAALYCFEQ